MLLLPLNLASSSSLWPALRSPRPGDASLPVAVSTDIPLLHPQAREASGKGLQVAAGSCGEQSGWTPPPGLRSAAHTEGTTARAMLGTVVEQAWGLGHRADWVRRTGLQVWPHHTSRTSSPVPNRVICSSDSMKGTI